MIARVARRHAWGVSGVSSTRIQRESLRRRVGCFVSSHVTKMPRPHHSCHRQCTMMPRGIQVANPVVDASARFTIAKAFGRHSTDHEPRNMSAVSCSAVLSRVSSTPAKVRLARRAQKVARAHAHGSPPDRDSTRFLPLLLGSRFSARADPRLTRRPSPVSPLSCCRPPARSRNAPRSRSRCAPSRNVRLSRVRRRSSRKRYGNVEATTSRASCTSRLTSLTDPRDSTRMIHHRRSRTTRRMPLPCP